MPPLSSATTEMPSSAIASTILRTLSMCCWIDIGVASSKRLDPAEGRSTTWHVTWSTMCGSILRHVAPLRGHP